MTFRTRDDALRFLYARINYERTSADRHDFRLDRMRRLLAELGDPQERIPAVHIAGTKGKGSTAVMTAAALSAAGLRTALYTSPHIERFEERMRLNGAIPEPDEFAAIADHVADAVARLEASDDPAPATYFEVATAIAWEFFARRGAEIVVLEVGVGGRLDATNVCRPNVVAITNVSRDHTELLGETPAEIAFEKAGIVKPGIPCVSGVTEPNAAEVVRLVCRERGSSLVEIAGRFDVKTARSEPRRVTARAAGREWGPLAVPLAGAHQAQNAAVSLFLLDELSRLGLPVTPDDVAAGWSGLEWPARIEIVARRPMVILDAAHNVASAAALLRTLEEDFASGRRILLFAGGRDKDVGGMLSRLAPAFRDVALTTFHNNPRALAPDQLLAIWQSITDRPARTFQRSDEALAWCRSIAGPDDLIVVTGSFFLAAELRSLARR